MNDLGLTDVNQLGIVSGDLDRTIRAWADKYGVGPWQVFVFDPSNMRDLTIDGRPTEYAMKIALAFLGNMMLEVIEPLDDRSVYARSLEHHGGADHIHHVLCATDSFSETVAAFGVAGVECNQTGYMTETDASFAYLDTGDDLGFQLEVVAAPPELTLPEPISVYPPPGSASPSTPGLASAAASPVSDTRAVVEHHLEALQAADLERTLSDYTGNAVLVTGGEVFRGREAIAGVLGPAIEMMFAPAESRFALETLTVDGDHALITWSMTFPGGEVKFGTDTFVVRDGRIAFQSGAVSMG